jgi:glucokinase
MGENYGMKPNDVLGAIDIGGTKVSLALVSPAGQLLEKQSFSTMDYPKLEEVLEQIIRVFQRLIEGTSASIQGIGVGCTGQMIPEAGVISHLEYLPDWEGPGLVKGLVHHFGIPVYLANDAETAALGEWTYGVGKDTQTFMLVTVGTGIGVGVIHQGQLWRGVNGAHPEIGHHIIEPDGPGCYCGGCGCWESMASGTALERWMREQDPASTHRSGFEICTLADQGDPNALHAVQRTAHYLGIGIANLVNIFAPEVIALSGGLMQSSHLFLSTIEAAVENNCKLVPFQQVKIRMASLGNDAVLLGAATLSK